MLCASLQRWRKEALKHRVYLVRLLLLLLWQLLVVVAVLLLLLLHLVLLLLLLLLLLLTLRAQAQPEAPQMVWGLAAIPTGATLSW